jgi:hypothetical protein
MAAILVLMLGSSVIFVRRKPDRSGPSRVSVTERGVPEKAAEEMRPERIGIPRERSAPFGRSARRERDEERAAGGPVTASGGVVAAAPAAAANESEARATKGGEKAMDPFAEAPAPARSHAVAAADDIGGGGEGVGALADRAPEAKKKDEASGAAPGEYAAAPRDPYGSAMDLYSAGRYAEADKAFTDIAASGARNAANAALFAAKSAEGAYGCGRAVAKYESTATRFAGTSAAAEAQWGAANCYKLIGDFDRSYALYNELRSVAGYRDRAEAALANLKILQAQGAARASRAPAKPVAPAAPPPQATAAPKNASQPSQ